mmetsp:Transcript_18888/g.36515  ORF Transcript_18888/g.36515 Transcript_18888/m.36515 type:complete len:544 (+) Transcript_18888:89-1720(+)
MARTSLDLVKEARLAIEDIYKSTCKIYEAVESRHLAENELDAVPFCGTCTVEKREALQEIITGLKALLTMHRNRRKGESEISKLHVRVRAMMKDLSRSERTSASLVNSLENAQKVLSRRCGLLAAKRKDSMETHEIISNLQIVSDKLGMPCDIEEEDGSKLVSIFHTTDDNFYFVADVKLKPEAQDPIEETSVTFTINGQDKTYDEANEDFKNILQNRQFSELAHKLKCYIGNEKFLSSHKEHKLDDKETAVCNTLQTLSRSLGTKSMRLIEGPALVYLTESRLKCIPSDSSAFSRERSDVQQAQKIVYVGCKSSEMSQGLCCAFEIRPPVLMATHAARALSRMNGVEKVSFEPVLPLKDDPDSNGLYPSLGRMLAGCRPSVTIDVLGQQQTWHLKASSSLKAGMSNDLIAQGSNRITVRVTRIHVKSLECLMSLCVALRDQALFNRLGQSCFFDNLNTIESPDNSQAPAEYDVSFEEKEKEIRVSSRSNGHGVLVNIDRGIKVRMQGAWPSSTQDFGEYMRKVVGKSQNVSLAMRYLHMKSN